MLSKKEFIEQYPSLIQKYKLADLNNESLEEFYDACVKSKGWFKNHIGKDLSCTYEIEVDKEVENEGELIPYIGSGKPEPFPKLNGEAKKYLEEHGKISVEDCKEITLPDGRRVMKIVNRVVAKAKKNNDYDYSNAAQWIRNLDDFQYKLEQYFNTKTDVIRFSLEKYDVTISCDPLSFLKLAYNGCDNGTCFGGNGHNGHARYRLATARNSFVVLVKDPKDPDKAIGRCWGFYNYTRSTWNVSNFYVKGLNKQAFAYLLKIVIDEITEKDHSEIKKLSIATGNGVYNNKDGYVFSYKKDGKKVSSITIKYPTKLTLERFCGNPILIG